MVARNRARYLAPLALAATIVGGYLIVHAGVSPKHQVASHLRAIGRRPGAQRKSAQAKFYVVRSGDSLTGIASRTGVPLARLTQLNPKFDPNSLQTAQRLRLSP